ncbi:hypothetical protein LXA43DRAFT_1030199 [Ganoderma leucocontextum]|nr:hypothetical protein LXA43DRAFT_1030199 [Ganoderma leucocontextum]
MTSPEADASRNLTFLFLCAFALAAKSSSAVDRKQVSGYQCWVGVHHPWVPGCRSRIGSIVQLPILPWHGLGRWVPGRSSIKTSQCQLSIEEHGTVRLCARMHAFMRHACRPVASTRMSQTSTSAHIYQDNQTHVTANHSVDLVFGSAEGSSPASSSASTSMFSDLPNRATRGPYWETRWRLDLARSILGPPLPAAPRTAVPGDGIVSL